MEQNVTWRAPGKLFFVMVSLLVLSGLLILSSRVDSVVKFTDPNLEKAVREKINQPKSPITRLDVLAITELDVSGREVRRLEGIESLNRLAELSLANNAVEDLSPLADLGMLVVLNLDNNQISDLETVRFDEITHLGLRSLSLRDNSIENIEPLSHFYSLQELNLRGNRIKNLEPLAGLTGLVSLNIHSNPVNTGLDALSSLRDLQELIMRNVVIGDNYHFLGNLRKLQRLNIRNTGITDMSVVGSLMSMGALQDDIKSGIKAVIDIRDNPVLQPTAGQDKLGLARDFWQNLSYRLPYDLPRIYIAPPRFSMTGGFYKKDFMLELVSPGGADIYFTLDGSDPDPFKNVKNTYLYKDKIQIINREGQPNTVSAINPTYKERNWPGPEGSVFKATVVRARTINSEQNFSEVVTHTYFVDENMWTKYQVPIVSIATDSGNLFDYETGIYVPGKIYADSALFWRDMNPNTLVHYHPANFHQRGDIEINIGSLTVTEYDEECVAIDLPDHQLNLDFSYLRDVPQIVVEGTKYYDGIYYLEPSSSDDRLIFKAEYVAEVFPSGAQIKRNWERPIHLEFYESDGSFAFAQNLDVRIHGSASRAWAQKTLRFYASSEYDSHSSINYALFPESNTQIFKRFLLRSTLERSGLDDLIAQSFMSTVNPEMDIQRYRAVAVFINGEFWGWYNIRDRYDEWYLSFQHGFEHDQVVLLEGNGVVAYGNPGDEQSFKDMVSFIKRKDLSDPDNYEYIKTLMDVDNYQAYMLTGIYLNYVDWGTAKHQLVWRYVGEKSASNPSKFGDGRWRWLPLDLDGTFTRGGGPEKDALREVIKGPYILNSLLANDEFRILFINRFADMLNTVFEKEQAATHVMNIVKKIPTELVEENISRWRHLDSSDEWYKQVDDITGFLDERPQHMREHICNYFSLSGQATVTVNVDASKGAIQINTIKIDYELLSAESSGSWSGIYFQDVPIKITAVPAPGYRFVGWKETGSKEADLILMLTEDITLTAEFEKAE